MWLVKPNWIFHGHDFPINTIDCEPAGNKILTASSIDNTIRIWSMECIDNKESEDELLCTLTQHEGSVNCVRWAPNSQYFASAADDKLVLVWEQYDVFNEEEMAENWKPILTLRGHSTDVKEVCWTADCTYLASGSLDSTVIIWDFTNRKHAPLHILNDQNGCVSGLCFDPLDIFLASQSADGNILIWKTADWRPVHSFSNRYKNNAALQFQRLSWSPDGLTLMIPGGKVSTFKHIATAISRDNWATLNHFCGHVQSVCVTKFSPSLYSSDEKPKSYFAIGANDGALSVFDTVTNRPVIVLTDIFESGVSDIAWSPNGKRLFAVSSDGTILCINFTPEFFGTELDTPHVEMHFMAHYNMKPTRLTQYHKEVKVVAPKVITEQKVMRLENGRRRIIPSLISTPDFSRPAMNSNTERPIADVPRLPNPAMWNNQRDVISILLYRKEVNSQHLPNVNLLSVKNLVSSGQDVTLEVNRLGLENGMAKCSVKCVEGPNQHWETFVNVEIVLATGNKWFCAVYGEATLYVFSSSGRRLKDEVLFPNIKWLSWEENNLFILHEEYNDVTFHIWEVSANNVKQDLVLPISAFFKQCRSEKYPQPIKKVEYIKNAHLALYFIQGEAYCFDFQIQQWSRIMSPNVNIDSTDAIFERNMWNPSKPIMNSFEVDNKNLSNLSLEELDIKIARCKLLNKDLEYRECVQAYVRMLIDSSMDFRLRDFVNSFDEEDEVLESVVHPILTDRNITLDIENNK